MIRTIELSADQMIEAISEYLSKHRHIEPGKAIKLTFQTRIRGDEFRYVAIVEDIPTESVDPSKPTEVYIRKEPRL